MNQAELIVLRLFRNPGVLNGNLLDPYHKAAKSLLERGFIAPTGQFESFGAGPLYQVTDAGRKAIGE